MESKRTSSYLIGFCSLPFNRQQKFVKDEIENRLFSKYKKHLKQYSSKKDKDFTGLFDPELYYLWGKFDICAIAAVDDFEFATRFFRPYNPRNKKKIKSADSERLQTFDYKVINTINTNSSPITAVKPLPFIAVCELKVNSALLMGNGLLLVEFLKRHITATIKNITEKGNYLLHFKVGESFSYHEIILILTSNSLYALKEIVLSLRNTSFKELSKLLPPDEAKNLINNSLLPGLVGKEEFKNVDPVTELQNHLFESTFTSFGLHFNLFDSKSNITKDVVPPKTGEELTFFSKWNTKPGHSDTVNEILASCDKALGKRATHCVDHAFTVAGKGDLLLQKRVKIVKDLRSNKFLDFPEILFKTRPALHENVIDTFTTLSIGPSNHFPSKIKGGLSKRLHLNTHQKLVDFTIGTKEIRELKLHMNGLWVPKVLNSKVLKLISNYNSAVVNPDMYGFYVELYPFIKYSLLETVKSYYLNINNPKAHAVKLYDVLHAICHSLESGFENRFYQSYWTSDVPEVNMDYTGGIHNLISAYDSCYKGISNVFGGRENISFVHVKSDNRVTATPTALEINYLHLTQPLYFCSVVVHECCNFVLGQWLYKKTHAEKEHFEEKTVRILSLLFQADINYPVPFLRTDLLKRAENAPRLFDDKSSHYKALVEINNYLNTNVAKFIVSKEFKYFIVDRLTYQYGFKDFELFKNVHWNYHLQSGHIMTRPNVIHHSYYINMVIRLALVRISLNGGEIIAYDEFCNLSPKGKYFDDLRAKFLPSIYTLIRDLFKIPTFHKWFLDWEKLISEVNLPLIPEILPFEKELEKLLNAFFDDDLGEINTLLNALSNTLKSESDISSFYINLIRKFLHISTQGVNMLDRTYTGIPIIDTSLDSSLYTDFCGGTFATGRKHREQYFNQNVKFLRLLFHVSQIHKKMYVLENLKHHRKNKEVRDIGRKKDIEVEL